jgi:hypothetical protein
MKSLQEFKLVLTEEEKQDYSKFDALIRAGLGNKAQIARLHKILEKMGEERPVFNPADRQIMQNLFNKMVDLISNNKQLFTQTRRAVKEELDESLLDTSDFKIGPSGKKVRAHRIKVGDKITQGDDTEGQTPRYESVETVQEGLTDIPLRGDPPFTLVLKRKAIRLYPNDTKIALYYSDRLRTYFSVPYSNIEGNVQGPIQAEEVQWHEEVDHIAQLKKIKDTHSMGTIKHSDGSSSKVDVQTAHAILTVHNALSDDNKKKYANMVSKSKGHFGKAADFAWKSVK